MSAALQLPLGWGAPAVKQAGAPQPHLLATAVQAIHKKPPRRETFSETAEADAAAGAIGCFAFYRKHTENLLRRYLYASMQVGRSPDLLGESVGRGWVSSRPVRTFEDALIFVLDVERCLKKLSSMDQELVSRILLQEYTQPEAAVILGLSARTISTKLSAAIDRLTEHLVEADLLVLPD